MHAEVLEDLYKHHAERSNQTQEYVSYDSFNMKSKNAKELSMVVCIRVVISSGEWYWHKAMAPSLMIDCSVS